MIVKAYKYQGAGNDFVIIDNRKGDVSLTSEQIKLLCDRRFGIGSDGLMYLGKSENYDFSMTYFNSDGNEGTMCGNGGRCLVAFAAHRGLKSYRFEAIDGEHIAKVISYSPVTCFVELGMIDVTSIKEHSPKSFILNTGSPHMVNFVDNLKEYDVIGQGRLWRHHTMFPEGTNVNFVQGNWGRDSAGWSSIFKTGDYLELSVRTFERGVEDETLACGTGITASAVAYHHLLSKNFRNRSYNNEIYPTNIRTKIKAVGGDLEVTFKYMGGERYTNIILKGNASFVFKCDIEI
ncbi:MAG TPA: diaminopimelate epimerase [Rikenellaceae bacterium]|nr:MAG: diaminopimelate epimerase [Bacteroidetes bacterium GWE2_40_15]HBZ25846.1 diaminopimelate epimerase [Rikenellaceae bacterium]